MRAIVRFSRTHDISAFSRVLENTRGVGIANELRRRCRRGALGRDGVADSERSGPSKSVTPAGSLLRFLGVDLPVLLGLGTGADVRDVRIDAGFGRPVVGLLGAGYAPGGFFFLLLDPRPFPGALHGGWS